MLAHKGTPPAPTAATASEAPAIAETAIEAFVAAAEAAIKGREHIVGWCHFGDALRRVRTAEEAHRLGYTTGVGWRLRAYAHAACREPDVVVPLPPGIPVSELFRPDIADRLVAAGYPIEDRKPWVETGRASWRTWNDPGPERREKADEAPPEPRQSPQPARGGWLTWSIR